MQQITRRSLLQAGAAGAAGLWLAACGSESSSPKPALVQRWPMLTPGPARLTVSLANDAGMLSAGPAMLSGRLVAADGSLVADGLGAARRSLGEGTIPFWAFETMLPAVGLYTLLVDGASVDGAAVQAVDPASITIPAVGDTLPPLDTPTLDDPRGVNPICTRTEGVCPLHTITLAEALDGDKPVAYFVGTPAHCQTGVCAPELEALLAVHAQMGKDVSFVHADVYTDDSATTTAPAIDAYGLTFEPALWVVDTSGRIVTRLDTVFNGDEMAEAIGRART